MKRCTHPAVVRRVGQLLESHDDDARVADILNAEGLRTGAGAPFNATAVDWIRYCHGLKNRQAILRQDGRLTVPEMARSLGVSQTLVRHWASHGRLRGGRFGTKAVWLFEPVVQQPEDIRCFAARQAADPAGRRPALPAGVSPGLLARVDLLLDSANDAAVADALVAEGVSAPSGKPFDAKAVRRLRGQCNLKSHWERLRDRGKLTAQQMACFLGIGLSTVHDWANRGAIIGSLCGKPPRLRWVIEPVELQPEPIRQRVAARATLGAGGADGAGPGRDRDPAASTGRGAV